MLKIFNPIVNLLTKWLSHNVRKENNGLCDFERIRHELKPCDILLVEGRSRVSRVIRRITQSPWSHAALYIGRLHNIEDETLREYVKSIYKGALDEQLIIESELGLGTVIQPLSRYKKEHVRICRPNGLNFKDTQKIIHYGVNQLGLHYDVRQIIDLARFFYPYSFFPRRWHSSLFHYSPGKATKTVCSTMIAEAFSSIQFPILPLVKKINKENKQDIQLFQRNPKLCVPSDFDYSPYFQIIKYPFLDYSYHADYKLLPWHGKITLEGMENELYLSADAIDELTHKNKLKTQETPPINNIKNSNVNKNETEESELIVPPSTSNSLDKDT